MNDYNICCVIVTYNRKELLLRNLNSLLSQTIEISKIFIIDNNGTDNTYEYIKNNFQRFDLIDYEKLDENIGGAGGFAYGLKKAYSNNYGSFWLMDDDGYAYNEKTLEKLCDYIRDNNLSNLDKYMINSLVLAIEDNELLSFGLDHYETKTDLRKSPIYNDGVILNKINPFNGTLISRGLVNAIGFPNKEFFIKGDEVDYKNRAKNEGSIICTIFDSNYCHPRINNRKKKKIFFHEMYVFVEAPWKEYYSIRNFTYSTIQLNPAKIAKKRIRFNYYKRILCVFLCKCKKRETLKMIKLGYKHGKNGILGSVIKP